MGRVTDSTLHVRAPLNSQRCANPSRRCRHGAVTRCAIILRSPVHVVAEIALRLAEVRIVGIHLLITNSVVFRPANHLLVTGVLVGHMAVKADFIRIIARCQLRRIGANSRMDRLHCRGIMAIQTDQILLGVEIPKQVSILQ